MSSLEHNNFGEEIGFELFTTQAAAGLHTTINDFTKFALASLYVNKNNKQQILSASYLQQMMTAAPNSGESYGLGYQVETIKGTSTTLARHCRANSGWHAIFRANPEIMMGL